MMRRMIIARLALAAGCCTLVAAVSPTSRPVGEKPPEQSVDCFPGAIYRKAVSSMDVWTGIDATIVLPTLTTDPARVDAKGRPLDNASSYVGGRAGVTEIDAGVSWEVIKEPDGQVSTTRKAFRPFWRNKKWQTGPAEPNMYFNPGDTIRLVCKTEAADKLTIRVELLARAGQQRPSQPIAMHEATFDAPGFGPGREQQFKRVSAIDQVGNEGKGVKSTHATSLGATWGPVDLIRGDERRPMSAERFTDMRCPDAEHVQVEPAGDASSERIDLRGTPASAH